MDIKGIGEKIKGYYYIYELTLSLSILEPLEKLLFSEFVFVPCFQYLIVVFFLFSDMVVLAIFCGLAYYFSDWLPMEKTLTSHRE